MRNNFALLGLALLAALPSVSTAQVSDCIVPDSIAVAGNSRVRRESIITDAGIQRGDTLTVFGQERAAAQLYQSGQIERLSFECQITGTGADRKRILVLRIVERPTIHSVEVRGAERIPEKQVRDKLLLVPGRVADPAEITRARVAVDSLYKARSFYLARISVDTTVQEGGAIRLSFDISEGRRLAISGITIEGNEKISDKDIVDAMGTKPEGFLWMKDGEFDDIDFESDLADSIPRLYASRGFIDMRIISDTLIVDPEIGKGMIIIKLEEGPQYKVGSFEIIGNRYFQTGEIQPLYPFRDRSPTLRERVHQILGGDVQDPDVFDQSRWFSATQDVGNMYRNDGFTAADINPVIERSRGADSSYVVNLRWDISEGSQTIINRIDIVGNDYTRESCIRQQITVFPGSIFSQEKLIQTMQRISAMGFFEDPLANPTFEPVNDSLGLLNVTITVKERKTGSVNFGASMGGAGGGLGGFIGFDQPNLFGQCKKGSLNWQFGSLINEFTVTYSDPAIRKSNISGAANLYHMNARYVVADFGRQVRTGGFLRFGFPFFGSYYTRAYLSYGGERVKYTADENTLLGQLADECDNCFRSTLGGNLSRDTRIGMPFPNSGVYQTLDAQFNGGIFGGTAEFQRYTTELRSYVPLGEVGGDPVQGTSPIRFSMGLSLRAGVVFGSTGPFFPNQEFSMGGVQQGEPLRGYDEFTITPVGYVSEGSSLQARRESFGKAYMSTTVEIGARLSQSVYASIFYDAGNVWRNPRDINPTRMFRGAGVGVALQTPLGPLGLDYAYGFDKLDAFGRPDPGWKLHFKLGQLF